MSSRAIWERKLSKKVKAGVCSTQIETTRTKNYAKEGGSIVGKTILLNDGWEFAKSALDVTEPTSLGFAPVDLPHDWLIYDTTNLYENSIGWYRRYLDHSSSAHTFLHFEGVYMDCSLYVNREWIGDWKNGYTCFEFEITRALRPGSNEILVKVVHQSPNSRWYSGAGIYRDVWLKIREADYLVNNGVYISTKPNAGDPHGWTIEVESEVVLGSGNPARLTHTLLRKGQVLARSGCTPDPTDGFELDRQSLVAEGVELWSPACPNLYQLVTTLEEPGSKKELDSVVHQVGFKDITLSPRDGLTVNGQKMKLQGVCEHHDLGALGAAFNKNALKRRLQILKEMGVNAIRTAHNAPAKALMDLADQMGFFVITEAFDMWERPKTPFDYARFFTQWAPRDVASWVRRDRNHPSLLMWSIGNEILDTHLGERGLEVTRMLIDLVGHHDPKGNGWITFGSNYLPWKNTQHCAELVEAVGYNYGAKLYQDHHSIYPHWVIYGSETGSVVQSRGIYHFPLEKPILADDDQQCSALGNSAVSWGAESAEACLDVERETPFSLGQFIWTGFDYIGEPTPYHTKNSYFGQVDTAGFPKDSYYIYQAAWTDYTDQPMVHLFPYWDFNLGQIIDVRIASNAPLVALERNGREVGRQDLRQPHFLYTASWKLPYEPGELKAVAYNEEGEVIASSVRHSFGDAARIYVKANQDEVTASGTDLIFLEVSMEDKQGHPVENATNRVDVQVSGAGRLVGLDNGDSTDFDQYKGNSRRLFSGKLLAIIASTLEPGIISVEVSSPGLPSQAATFMALPAEPGVTLGRSAQMENEKRPFETGNMDEIPLRKIELIAEGERTFTPTRKKIAVRAKFYPSNTSYGDLQWRGGSDGGIDSKLATLHEGQDGVLLTARGDGKFRLRCLSTNGTTSVRLFSELEFQAVGLGKLFKDPYELVSGGLYDHVVGEVGSGNERGVATARGEETQIGFADLDFGANGSDTITIWFFALTSDPYPVQIWEGKPGEPQSTLLIDTIYHKKSKWNVYQNETYTLSKRLGGISTLWIVTQDKMHIKGFTFAKQGRAFSRIAAADYEEIYGDSFVLRKDRVEQIGNNVTLDFGELDFGEEGTDLITIHGHTPLDRTLIQISFTTEAGENREQVEFLGTADYTEQVFALTPIQGKGVVRLIFLPGARFDFSWLQFSSRKDECV